MTDETTANPVVMAGDLITGPGLYEARCGEIVPITGWQDGWWVSYCDGVLDWFSSDGLQRCRANTDVGQWDLVRCVGPLAASEPEPETTTEQLAEIEGQAEDTPATEYTPPEGWRVLAVGEILLGGDEWVNWEGTESRPDILHGDGATVSGGRYIRRIKPEPQPEPQPQPEPIQVREGRWRTRGGQEFRVSPMPTDHWDFAPEYPWWDGNVTTWANDGRFSVHENAMDLVAYLGPIEEQPVPEPEPVPNTATIEELRSEVSYVQNLLGTERRRVTQLEELVASLRTINEGAERAVSGAGVVNDSLRLQLAAVKAELVTQAETSRRLQIELDVAQQVPADSPELRQLRADLADVTRERDQYLDSYQRIFGDLETIRETTKAAAVEAIAEWLQAFRGCNSPALALLLLEALPSIMRSLTGLADEEIE